MGRREMEIIVKTDNILQHQIKKEVAKPIALKEMRDILTQETQKATENWYRGRIDTTEAAKNATKYRKNLDKVSPETLSPQAKDIMWKKAKQLKDEFSVGMLSKEELHPVKGFLIDGTMKWVVDEERLAALNSVKRNSIWYKQNEEKIREFKNLMRHLCPEDANSSDIERFRPTNRGKR